MLLSTLTANLQSSYADIQVQIEALQEQQRLIQAQLQRVGSVESKMESAAALVAEAISEIREVCPGELRSYRETIESLFGDAPIAQLTAGNDEVADETKPAPVEPAIADEEVEIEAVEVAAVQVETQSEAPSEVIDTKVSPQASPRMLHKQPTKPLQWLASQRKIDFSEMRRHELAKALVGQVTQLELEEAIAQAV